jgi:hypothetical protein
MNSSTHRTLEKRKTQDEIRKQIELLKAQLDDDDDAEDKDEPCGSRGRKDNEKLKAHNDKKRKSPERGGGKGGVMLAPPTPSPRSSFPCSITA